MRREIYSAAAATSSEDPRAHFGLGDVEILSSLSVRYLMAQSASSKWRLTSQVVQP
ncbi:MAG: ASPIC/UnbV domain-containing protein [Ardenticatenaceae bacterium]|nr:ASPIC/UnbV domain-containing protein [Ardenticatenaceae bacterium]